METAAEPVESEIDHRRRVKRQQLAENQAPNDGDAEGAAELGTNPGSQSKRQTAKQRGHGGHHDGPETKETSFIDGVKGRFAFLAFGFEREINHHDGVFLDYADKENDAD